MGSFRRIAIPTGVASGYDIISPCVRSKSTIGIAVGADCRSEDVNTQFMLFLHIYRFIPKVSVIVMRADHDAACTGIGIVTDCDAGYRFRRVLRDSSTVIHSPKTRLIPFGLSKSKDTFLAASHIFNLRVFTDSDTATLIDIVINI